MSQQGDMPSFGLICIELTRFVVSYLYKTGFILLSNHHVPVLIYMCYLLLDVYNQSIRILIIQINQVNLHYNVQILFLMYVIRTVQPPPSVVISQYAFKGLSPSGYIVYTPLLSVFLIFVFKSLQSLNSFFFRQISKLKHLPGCRFRRQVSLHLKCYL